MLSKKVIKDIQLLGHKKLRDESRLFVAEGPKVVAELYNIIPGAIDAIYATADWLKNHPAVHDVIEVTEDELKKISFLSTPNQVLAVVKQFDVKEPVGTEFTLYLDSLQDPGNVGTIIRIADWFGVKQIVCSEGCADVYNPKTVQATMASISRVNVYYDKEYEWLKKQKVPVFAATLHGTPVDNVEKIKNGVLIIGNESRGINEELLQLATHQITIRGKGEAESLNAAVATGIILSHFLA